MIFEYERFCVLAGAATWDGSGEVEIGEAGQLGILYVKSGQCAAGGPGRAVPVEAGQLVLAHAPLAAFPHGACEATGVALAGGAPQQLCAALPAALVVEAAACPGAADLAVQLAAGQNILPTGEQSALGYTLLCRLCPAVSAGQNELPALVAAALAELETHYGEVYGVEELAAGLEVSKSHLIRAFTAALGTSPGRYLTAVRIAAAQKLLLHTDHSLEIIAGLCGFSGANYLCRAFKKTVGLSPAAWRRQNLPAAWRYSGHMPDESLYL